MHNFIIAYDIFDTKRLLRVKKIAYSYALGGQKSAVEAPLNASTLHSLISELEAIVKDEDKINIIKVTSALLLAKASSISYENGVIIL